MTDREIVIPREKEYYDFVDIPPYDYDFRNTKDINTFNRLMLSPIEELMIGITKNVNNSLHLTGLVELVSPEDKDGNTINDKNYDTLLSKVGKEDYSMPILTEIMDKDLKYGWKKGDDHLLLYMAWLKHNKVSKYLINKMLEAGIPREEIIFSQKKPKKLLEREVEVSEQYREPLKYFLPMIRNDGYTPILIHTHPVINIEIPEDVMNAAKKVYTGLMTHEIRDKILFDTRKIPSQEDLEMFRQIGDHGIGVLITREGHWDEYFELKNIFAFEVNDRVKSLPVRYSIPNEKETILKNMKEFSEIIKNYR